MGQYTWDLGRFGSLIPRYDSTWKSATYFDASEGVGPPNAFQGSPILPEYAIGQAPFWLHNARLTWEAAQTDLAVSFWVRNFMDQTYKTGGFNATAFANLTVAFLGDPRTFGFDVNYKF
jgi:outer membrane receptor protein involved in Fe transport